RRGGSRPARHTKSDKRTSERNARSPHGPATYTHARMAELLWTPSAERIERAALTRFQRERGFADYDALWRWSVEDLEGFWQAIWDYFHIDSSAPHRRVLGRRGMPGAEWFPGARLNYAQHVLRREPSGGDVLLHVSDSQPLT